MNQKCLFIGDSITDSGRRQDSEGIGHGYVRMIKKAIVTYGNVEVINKGVSGDRITDLEERWNRDVLALQPDVVSISIGINDVWRQLDHPEMDQVTPEDYKKIYEELVEKVKLLGAKCILMEPTIIEERIDSIGNQKLFPYVKIVRQLAEKYDALLVPTHTAFLEELQKGKKSSLTTDGVHMTEAGNQLMAKTWLDTCVDKLL
ncbi:SGNH/GDSL hydrolase family protein [Bacillus sp. N1-1]|jgi:acyl-CoA thioesterase I|uniref:SGNH/GDSL hydrolase family protein n=1 Tax=Bacillus sp. N1-1 TaxID=2682541 RepID=UPI0013189DB9|nr:SGNH/GDSL hydrolase family protein [Bacillus sp. N1-1]QHA90700.1 hydrolase [Bacillus sp. N1-1]